MFLWQKFKYNLTFLEKDEQFIEVKNTFDKLKPSINAWDTETTGLHIIKDKPFLVGFGFNKHIYVYEPTEWRNNFIFELMKKSKYTLAHNAKFDYHMMRNFGTPIPKEVNLADTLAMARITEYTDSLNSISLEAIGGKLVDEESKFASKVIKSHLNEINKERYKLIKDYVKANQSEIGMNYTDFKDVFDKMVNFVDYGKLNKHLVKVNKLAPKATYEDSYKLKPSLMINYLADDVVLVLEIYPKLLEVLDHVDNGRKTWHRENKLIRVTGDMEANGMKADIDYLKQSREKIIDYIDKTYKKMWDLVDISNWDMKYTWFMPDNDDRRTLKELKKLKDDEVILWAENKMNKWKESNCNFSVGQHAVIKFIFARKYRIGMLSTDEDALSEVVKNESYNKDAREVAELILELRTLSKWLSTYIEGMMNRVVDGRVYTDINNSGTVTGRVSSDFQQQPKEALNDKDGNELFHPRKPFINDEGYTNYYIDFSNMELRVQAYYTMITSDGDVNMCQAFMPFKYKHIISGEEYAPIKDIKEWDSGEWVNSKGELWKSTDLHSATTRQAFPFLADKDKGDTEFDHYRGLGKRANFLKNYGGGKEALKNKLAISDDIAEALNNGYYSAFPKILDYQKWVDKSIRAYGYVQNLMGRRYYFQDSNYSYKGYNYLIQGSCADYVKEKQIEIDELLKETDSSMLLTVHDEIIFKIKNGEEHLVPKLKEIMEDASMMMNSVPMVAEVSITHTNWAEKVEI